MRGRQSGDLSCRAILGKLPWAAVCSRRRGGADLHGGARHHHRSRRAVPRRGCGRMIGQLAGTVRLGALPVGETCSAIWSGSDATFEIHCQADRNTGSDVLRAPAIAAMRYREIGLCGSEVGDRARRALRVAAAAHSGPPAARDRWLRRSRCLLPMRSASQYRTYSALGDRPSGGPAY